MTIKEFITKAIEGGWSWVSIPYTAEDILGDYDFCLEKELLNPELWKAVAKVEGWDGYMQEGDTREFLYYANGTIFGWLAVMHQMIDALVDGKTIEQYLETL